MDVEYPPLPDVIHRAGGPIRVVLVKQARLAKGDDRAGTWDAESRVIEITKTLPMSFQWSTLYHEAHHATLDDAGLSHLLDEKMQEALCDATACAHMAELRATIAVDSHA